MSVCHQARHSSFPFLSDSKLTQPLPQYTVHRTLDMVDMDALDLDMVDINMVNINTVDMDWWTWTWWTCTW